VVLKWYFQEPLSDLALTLLARLQRQEVDFVAPDCLIPELGHSFRKLVLRGSIDADEAYAALQFRSSQRFPSPWCLLSC
jgi:hypothetical protein